MEITQQFIVRKRQEYTDQLNLVRGALMALDEIERELFPPDAISLGDLKNALGAVEVGEPEPIARK